ncbi:DUF2934 domain-containing protein, partial [Xanthomonas oryzae pv. oryzae]
VEAEERAAEQAAEYAARPIAARQ